MKKILLIMALCAAFLCVGTSASADIWCGSANILGICLTDSNAADVPNDACCVNFTYFPDGNIAGFNLWGTAFGTQINLALLKAYNDQRVGVTPLLPPIDVQLDVTQVQLPFGSSFAFVITDVGFGTCDACCACAG